MPPLGLFPLLPPLRLPPRLRLRPGLSAEPPVPEFWPSLSPPLPITVGSYFLKRAVDGPIRLFYFATIVAIALLGLSLIVAAIMAGAISQPIRRAAVSSRFSA